MKSIQNSAWKYMKKYKINFSYYIINIFCIIKIFQLVVAK